jgi:hypothetical protein
MTVSFDMDGILTVVGSRPPVRGLRVGVRYGLPL